MTQLSLTTIQGRVTRKLGLSSTGTDQTDITQYANEGYENFLARTGLYVKPGTMTLTAGQDDYELDGDILHITELWKLDSNSDPVEMIRVSPYELIALRRGTLATDQSVRGRYATQGMNQLMIYPTPDSAGTLELTYAPRPTLLSAGGDTPDFLPQEYHKALELWALAEMADQEDDESSAHGNNYRVMYEGLVAEAIKAKSKKGGRRLPKATIRGRRAIAISNDQDVRSY